MTETKEERPPSSAGGGSQTQQENEVANLNSLATLNLLHQQVPLIPLSRLIEVDATSCIRKPIPLPTLQTRYPQLRSFN
jgi:hypothetical protein